MTPARKAAMRKEINYYKKSFADHSHNVAEQIELGNVLNDWSRRELIKRHHKAQVAEHFEGFLDK